MKMIYHTDFIDNVLLIEDITEGEYKLLTALFNIHFKLRFKTNSIYKKDSYLTKVLNCCKDTLRDRRKSLVKKNYLVTSKSQQGTIYTINYDKILNTSNLSTEERQVATSILEQQENTITSTEIRNCAPADIEDATIISTEDTQIQGLSSKEMKSSAPAPAPFSQDKIEKMKEIEIKTDFGRFNEETPEKDISGPLFTKVAKIEDFYPLNEDSTFNLNLAYDKDSNNLENTKEIDEDMEKVLIPVIENMYKLFTQEEIVKWQDYLSNDKIEDFVNESADRIARYSTNSNLDSNYLYKKLINYITNYQQVEEVITAQFSAELPEDNDLPIPAWIWDALEKVYLINVNETEKNEYGDNVQVINRYLKPMEVIRPLYKRMIQKYDEEDRALIKQYAKVVYDDCAFTYKEYDKDIAA